MSVHVLLNLLNELRKSESNARLAEHLIAFSQYALQVKKYRSTNVSFFLSVDIKIIMKSLFSRGNVRVLPYA